MRFNFENLKVNVKDIIKLEICFPELSQDELITQSKTNALLVQKQNERTKRKNKKKNIVK